MIEIVKKNSYTNVFDNITELVKYVTTRKRKPGRDNSSEEKGNIDFYGTNTFEEAIERLKYGDEELYKKVKKEQNNIKINNLLGNAKKRQSYFNNTVGVIPNVPNFLLNIPNNMIDICKTKTSQKIINIFLNIRVSSFVEGKEVIKIGTKYLSIIDLLEKNGYRCNLYSGVANNGYSGDNCCMMVRIKTDREPLNIKKICFTIANPAMQRRIKFKWMEVNDGEKDYTDGYGQAMSQSSIDKMLKETFNEDFITWNYEDNNNSKTIEQIIKDLEKVGIKLDVD